MLILFINSVYIFLYVYMHVVDEIIFKTGLKLLTKLKKNKVLSTYSIKNRNQVLIILYLKLNFLMLKKLCQHLTTATWFIKHKTI